MNPCCIPAKPPDIQGDGRWLSQHNHHIAETKEREPDVVLIGDSIIHHLQLRPIWSDLFEPLHCLNFGIPGDGTEHVLWRISNGELENINPKVLVFLVGTNNINNTPDEVAEGILEIVKTARMKLPEAHIVIVELLPRGQFPNKLREKNELVNKLVKQRVARMDKVETVSSNKGLVQQDGSISHHDMPDFLHLSETGYRKGFEPLYELLTQLLNENEKEQDLTLSE